MPGSLFVHSAVETGDGVAFEAQLETGDHVMRNDMRPSAVQDFRLGGALLGAAKVVLMAFGYRDSVWRDRTYDPEVELDADGVGAVRADGVQLGFKLRTEAFITIEGYGWDHQSAGDRLL